MIKKKVKAKKIISKKKTKKRVVVLRTKKRKIKDPTPDIIFDSNLGKTDALFINNPVEEKNKQVDPDIEQALKEFDVIQKNQIEAKDFIISPETITDLNSLDNVNNQNKKEAKTKRSFWKRLFSLNNRLFSIAIGLVFAGVFCTGVYVFATYGVDEPYPIGNTLTPTCTPGATNCTTVYPVPYTGATLDIDLGSKNFTTTGTFGAGATTLSSLIVDANTLVVDGINNRVGIGTISPGVKFEVVGDTFPVGRFVRTTATSNLVFFAFGNVLKYTGGNPSAGFGLGFVFRAINDAGTVNNVGAIYGVMESWNASSNYGGGGLRFSVFDNADSPVTAMSILSNGKIGIGTTAPKTKLHVWCS